MQVFLVLVMLAVPVREPVIPGCADVVIYQVNPYAEYIDLYSKEEVPVSLNGWMIHSVVGGETFVIPDIVINPQANGIVRIWSGPSPSSRANPIFPIEFCPEQEIVWTEGFVWNNAGDEAELISPDNVIVDTWVY